MHRHISLGLCTVLVWVFLFQASLAQDPLSSLSVSQIACDGQAIELANNTPDIDSAKWSVCTKPLGVELTQERSYNVGNLGTLRSAVSYQEGENHYVFICDAGGAIRRLSYGNSMHNTPTSTVVASGMGSGIIGSLGIAKEGGNYYLLAVRIQNPNLYFLDFGNSVSNTPTLRIVSISSDIHANGASCALVEEEGVWYALVNQRTQSRLVKHTFANGLHNSPTASAIVSTTVGQECYGMTHVKDEASNRQYTFLISYPNRRAYRVSWGATGMSNNAPQTTDLGDFQVPLPVYMHIVKNEFGYYAFYSGQDTPFYVAKLGTDLSNLANMTFENIPIADASLAPFALVKKDRISYHMAQFLNSSGDAKDFDINLFSCQDSNYIYTTPTANHSLQSSRTVAIYHQACNGTNCHDTLLQIPVVAAPNLLVNIPPTCAGSSTQFATVLNLDSADSNPSYLWDFGDGSGTSTAAQPQHTFPTGGPYTVALSLSTQAGCQIDTSLSVIVNPAPAVNFSTLTDCGGDSLTFSNLSTIPTGDFTLARWDMGNGQILNRTDAQSITDFKYLYTQPGSYTVHLTMFTDEGCIDSSSQVVIQPGTDFTFGNTCLGESTTFSPQTTAPEGVSVTEYSWDFDDGNPPSTGAAPTRTFGFEGTYQVTLTVSYDNDCQDVVTKPVLISPLPSPDFQVTQTCAGLSTAFSDASTLATGQIATWGWDFGASGAGNTSTQRNPTYVYAAAGDYTVNLTVTSQAGCTEQTSRTISIAEAETPEFLLPESFCQNQPATLQVLGSYESFLWRLPVSGGLQLSTLPNPSFRFAQAGSPTLRVTVTDANGCVQEIDSTLTVHPTPESLSMEITPLYADELNRWMTDSLVRYVAVPTQAGTYSWQFGTDPQVYTGDSVDYVFEQAGEQQVQLTLSTPEGCTLTATRQLSLIAPPAPLLDLALVHVQVIDVDNQLRTRLRLRNAGNTLIQSAAISLAPEGNQPVVLPLLFVAPLEPEQTLDTLLTVLWPQRSGVPFHFFCAEIMQVNAEPDTVTHNNRQCLPLSQDFFLDALFPSPASTTVNVRYSIGQTQPLNLSLLNMSGLRMLQEKRTHPRPGLYDWALPVSGIAAGTYMLELQQGGQIIRRRFIVLPQ